MISASFCCLAESWISNEASMEVKVERADAGEACESYTMLVESEAIVRSHRKLRREVCVSRVVVSLLLLTCMAFCVILYRQQLHESKVGLFISND